ncbi:hypothetical protein WI57_03250 [Burkholderia cepacia]|nr:hypothetical protein WI57_03250 [Burkholderia cepacia]
MCRHLDAIVQPRLPCIRQTRQISRFWLVAAHLDAEQRALQPRLAAKHLVPRHSNAPPRLRMRHVDHGLHYVRAVVLGNEIRPQIFKCQLIRRVLQEILVAGAQVALAYSFRRLVERRTDSIRLVRYPVRRQSLGMLGDGGIIADRLLSQSSQGSVEVPSASNRYCFFRGQIQPLMTFVHRSWTYTIAR